MSDSSSLSNPEAGDISAGWALGILTPAEHLRFQRDLDRDLALQGEAAAFSAVTAALAASAPPITPPPHLKQQVLARIAAEQSNRGL